MSCAILLNLYKHSLLSFPGFKAGIRNIPGTKQRKNGYSKYNPKLITVSFIKRIWVFL